jgi:chemotaxis protein methyltransferase CheR
MASDSAHRRGSHSAVSAGTPAGAPAGEGTPDARRTPDAGRTPAGALPAEVRARIAGLVAAHAGLVVPDWVLDARVLERLAALGLQGPGAGAVYADRLADPAQVREREILIEALRVGETRFFRHAAHVRALLDVVAPTLARHLASVPAPQRVVRAWSMGCATGEEAYTLAMILGGALGEHEVRVLGTDVSERALAVARAGVYTEAAVARVPEPWRSACFVPAPGAGRVQVAPALRRQVSFVRHNLLERGEPEGWAGPATSAGFDVIWCRNVLIYFAPEARRQVVARCARTLAMSGFLFIGYSESLRDSDEFTAVRTADAVLYRRAAAGAGQGRVPPATAPPRAPRAGDVAGRPSGIRPDDTGRMPAPALPEPGVNGTARADAGAAVAHELLLSGRYDSSERLARELRAAMAGGHGRVVVDLDGAELLDEEAAAVLRRAQRAARAAGTDLQVRATRPGARRWLRRHGLDRSGTGPGDAGRDDRAETDRGDGDPP